MRSNRTATAPAGRQHSHRRCECAQTFRGLRNYGACRTAVRAHTGSGNETIEGVHGNRRSAKRIGRHATFTLTGDIAYKPVRGICVATRSQGQCGEERAVATSSWRRLAPAMFDLHTGSGNITVRGLNGTFRGEAGSGRHHGEGTQTGSWEIRTGSGNVHVRLPGNSAFEADLSTSSGTLDIDAPITMTVQGACRRRGNRSTPSTRRRPVLKVHTGSGDILSSRKPCLELSGQALCLLATGG